MVEDYEVNLEAIAWDEAQEDVTDQVTWLWDFGDDVTSDENPTTHAWENPGNYTITVTGTLGEQQAQDTLQAQVEEEDPNAEEWILKVQFGPQGQDAEGEVCHGCEVVVWHEKDTAPDVRRVEFWRGNPPNLETTNNDSTEVTEGETTYLQWDCVWHTCAHNDTETWRAKVWDETAEEGDVLLAEPGPIALDINNVVIHGTTGIIKFDPDPEAGEALNNPKVKWHITHMDPLPWGVLEFGIRVEICGLGGGPVHREVVTQVGEGDGEYTWDGTCDDPVPDGPDIAPKGIYTYRLIVDHDTDPPEWEEHDAMHYDHDKSEQLEIQGVDVPTWQPDLLDRKVEFRVHYGLSQSANAVAIRVFAPNLDCVFTQVGFPASAGEHTTDTLEFTFELTSGWTGAYWIVVYAWESEQSAQSNRDRAIKPALQKGAGRGLYPKAENFIDSYNPDIPQIAEYQREVWHFSRYSASYTHDRATAPHLEDQPDTGFPVSALMVFKGHALAGQMTLWHPDYPGQRAAHVYGRPPQKYDEYSDMAMSNHYGDWPHLRLVVWMGCETGATDPVEGCLPQETVNAGASWSIGWNDHYGFAQGAYWLKAFFWYACKQGQPADDALGNADWATQQHYGDGYDKRLENRNICGTVVDIVPAGYDSP